MKWALADAKNRFSELVDRVLKEGPQSVTRHGKDCVVVVSAGEFARLSHKRKPLGQFLLEAPKVEGFEAERDRSPMRKVDL